MIPLCYIVLVYFDGCQREDPCELRVHNKQVWVRAPVGRVPKLGAGGVPLYALRQLCSCRTYLAHLTVQLFL